MIHHLAQLVHHCYYAGEIAAGRRAAERLLSLPGLPHDVEQLARSNRTWYTPVIEELCASAWHMRIDVQPVYDGWSTFNPTLINHGGYLIGIVRSSNYQIVDGRYVMPEADAGTIRTENILVRFTPELAVASQRHIIGPDYPHTNYPVVGLEDCRLRTTPTGLGVSCTIRDAAPWTDGRCRVGTADLDVESATLSGLRVLDGIHMQEHEKNWMPIEGRGGWLYAASHDGHVVTVDNHPDLPGGYQVARRSTAPPIAAQFRGGSQLVPAGSGWLGLVHEVAFVDGQRAYEHRWVWFDAALRLRRMSPWFAFQAKQQIEFAAGLARCGDRLVVSYGVRDAEAWLVTVKEDDVDACLQDVAGDGLRAAG